MKRKKYFVKFEFHDSAKPVIKYLYNDNKQIKLFYDLAELEKELKIFCNNFNKQKIEELYNYILNDLCLINYSKEDINIEQYRIDGQWVTIIFTIHGAPIYEYYNICLNQ